MLNVYARNTVDDVLDGKLLKGANKYNTGKSYEKFKAGHYHLGPYNNSNHRVMKNIREHNDKGSKSGPIIHYCWRGKSNELILLAFSPSHNPFPDIKDRKNPLGCRLRTIYPDDWLVNVRNFLGIKISKE